MTHASRSKAFLASAALSALGAISAAPGRSGLQGEEPPPRAAPEAPPPPPTPESRARDTVHLAFSVYRTHGAIAGLRWHGKAGKGEGQAQILGVSASKDAAAEDDSARPQDDPAAPVPSAKEMRREAQCIIFERDGRRWKVHVGDLVLTLEKLSYSFGGTEFVCDEDGWKFDGRPEPAKDSPIETIAMPRVTTAIGQSFEVAIGAECPVQYFVKRPDGLFELKTLKVEPPDSFLGLRLSTRAERTAEGKIRLDDLTLALQAVGERKPIEGVNLDVGEPLLTKKQLKATITIEPRAECGVILAPPGEGAIILRIRGELVQSGEDRPR